MGVFDKMFKSQRDVAKKEIEEFPWHPLTGMEQLDELVEKSDEQPALIFKHSTRCGVSRMVLRSFENEMDLSEGDDHQFYYLDLIANRDISNEIAKRFDVQHESPQVIILKDGKAVHHASHHSIQAEVVKDYL